MTDKARPDQPKREPDLARFLQDWTALWQEELQVQANDPEGVKPAMLAGLAKAGMPFETSAATEMWRAAMAAWAGALGTPPSSLIPSRDHSVSPGAASPGPQTAAAASDARDAEVERLARRVDELETRLGKLEATRRRRG
jgi:hypothetical protein